MTQTQTYQRLSKIVSRASPEQAFYLGEIFGRLRQIAGRDLIESDLDWAESVVNREKEVDTVGK